MTIANHVKKKRKEPILSPGLADHAWSTTITTVSGTEVLATLKGFLTWMVTRHFRVVTCMAAEGARVSTAREHSITGFGAPSILDLVKFRLGTNQGYCVWVANTLKLDAVADLEAAVRVQQNTDDTVPHLRLLCQQLGVAKNVHALATYICPKTMLSLQITEFRAKEKKNKGQLVTFLARESPTQTRLLVFRNPMLLLVLLRTRLKMIMSFSSPWNPSTVETRISLALGTELCRSLSIIFCRCPEYMARMVIKEGLYPCCSKY